jgi:SET domain-containing protein
VPQQSKLKSPRFRIGRSRTGLGLFAEEPIRKGRFVAEYWGKRIPTKTADDLNTKYLFEINTRWTVDGSDRRNVARYINHACRPNCETNIVRGAIKIRATKNIKVGDEITYNYGSGYFEMYIKPVGCKCASCVTKRRLARAKKRAEKA